MSKKKHPRTFTVEIDGQFSVTITQPRAGRDTYVVTYGQQQSVVNAYASAATDFGLCIFHALACAGIIEPEDKK